MRLKEIYSQNILPVKRFDVADLADVIVIAGPNGVGKTRLIEGLLQYFQGPGVSPTMRIVVEATCEKERQDWGQALLDTANQEDVNKLVQTLQQNRRRSSWSSSVLNFESDRTIQQINPYNFSWDYTDPWTELLGYNIGFGGLRGRFQDTLHSIFRKVRSRKEDIAEKVVELIKQQGSNGNLAAISENCHISIDPADFPDPLEPFKRAFTQLLAPKELLDADPKRQQLDYSFEGHTFPITTLSSGEREVVNIVFDFILRNPTDCIVVFDEPELHLHPELSYKLLQTLRTIGANNQFIFCTHSPDIITASLDQSVVFVGPPRSDNGNQAIVVREDDQTNQALKLLGQSVGIIALGKRIVLIEGGYTSLDKQTYGAILKNRFPNLVLVPSGGKGVITSFDTVHREVLERTVWGVEFFMLCDRDAVPLSKGITDIEQISGGRLKVLNRYHLENYFLDETVLSRIFANMDPEDSWLTSPTEIRKVLRELAYRLVSYTVALTASSHFREQVGNLDLMVKGCDGKSADGLVSLILARTQAESARFNKVVEAVDVEAYTRDLYTQLKECLDNDTDEWKQLIPGKQLLNLFANRAKLEVGRLKTLYIREAERIEPYPFEDIVTIFSEFSK